jgi:hypothetical protein
MEDHQRNFFIVKPRQTDRRIGRSIKTQNPVIVNHPSNEHIPLNSLLVSSFAQILTGHWPFWLHRSSEIILRSLFQDIFWNFEDKALESSARHDWMLPTKRWNSKKLKPAIIFLYRIEFRRIDSSSPRRRELRSYRSETCRNLGVFPSVNCYFTVFCGTVTSDFTSRCCLATDHFRLQ